jgi:hypothetical protein
MMAQYRKKPVVIDAVQMTAENFKKAGGWPEWLLDASKAGTVRAVNSRSFPNVVVEIATLEGLLLCNEDDWIIRGIKGELYPCKPDIFAATYEPV